MAEEAKVKEMGQARRERERVKRNGTRINNRGQDKGKDKGKVKDKRKEKDKGKGKEKIRAKDISEDKRKVKDKTKGSNGGDKGKVKDQWDKHTAKNKASHEHKNRNKARMPYKDCRRVNMDSKLNEREDNKAEHNKENLPNKNTKEKHSHMHKILDHKDNIRRILVPVSNSNLNEGFH